MSDQQMGENAPEPTWEERVANKVGELNRVANELGDIFEEKLPGAKAAISGSLSGIVSLLGAGAMTPPVQTPSIE